MEEETTGKTVRTRKALPIYASNIRELRRACGLTQPQFAAELKVAPISVARWETGTRVPSTQNYDALAMRAARRVQAGQEGMADLAAFFASQIGKKQTAKKVKLEERESLRYLETVERQAEAGDQGAQHLLALSRRQAVEFAKEQLKRINEARQSLKNGAFAEMLYKIADEIDRVSRLQGARQVRISRRIAVLKAQAERLESRERQLLKLNEAQQQELFRLCSEASRLAREGKGYDVAALVKNIANVIDKGQSKPRRRQVESLFMNNFKLGLVSRLFSQAASAEERGKPIDPVLFMDAIEETLQIGPPTPNAKE